MNRRSWGTSAIVAALLVAGCGSDDDTGSDGTARSADASTSATVSETEPTSTPSTASSIATADTDTTVVISEPGGEPILLGVFGSSAERSLDSAVDGATAAAEAINGRGGVGGRPLEIVSCDIGLDPNQASACARDLVAEGIVAAVGSGGAVAGQILPVLASAGIASVGHFSIAQDELLATNAFPLISGGIGFIAGEAALAAELGATKINMVRADVAATEQLPSMVALGLAPSGLALGDVVPIPLNTQDMAPYVASATRGDADAVLLALGVDDVVKFSRAAKQSGTSAVLISDASGLSSAIDQGFASEVDGVYAVGWFKPADLEGDPAVDTFNAEMDAVGSKAPRSQVAENAWASVYLFERAAAGTDISAAAVLAAMPTVTDFDIGLTPPISFGEPVPVIPGVPLQLFSPYVFNSQVKDGTFEAIGTEAVNVLAPQG